MSVTKVCGFDYPFPDEHHIWTLPLDCVIEYKPGEKVKSGRYQRYHKESGWTIDGQLYQDYYCWVEDFKASHPIYGTLEGDFNCEVTASSDEAWHDFLKHHPYDDFCPGDI